MKILKIRNILLGEDKLEDGDRLVLLALNKQEQEEIKEDWETSFTPKYITGWSKVHPIDLEHFKGCCVAGSAYENLSDAQEAFDNFFTD